MWTELKNRNDSVEICEKSSVFVGDAAGRHKTKVCLLLTHYLYHNNLQIRPKKDHSFADRFFASNVGVPFQTPEQFFGKSAVEEPWGPPAFEPKKLFEDGIPLVEPENARLVPEGKEIIVMVGFPGSGKSRFSKKLGENGYKVRI